MDELLEILLLVAVLALLVRISLLLTHLGGTQQDYFLIWPLVLSEGKST